MRLESALFSSSSGLEAHGSAMAVIGDNVSNANTTAYKAGIVQFSDLLSEGADGRNSSALPVSGSGVEVDQVRQDHTSGGVEITGRPLDVTIEGEGFFVVGDTTNPQYTRAGSFIIDENGLLSTAGGQNVLGFTGDTTTLQTIDMLGVDLSGSPTSTVTIKGNVSSQSGVVAQPAAPATFQEIGENAAFVNTVTVFDSLGESHDITLGFFKEGPNRWSVGAFIDGGDVNGGTAGTPVRLGQITPLNFDLNGEISEADVATAQIVAAPAYANGAAAGNITMNLAQFSQYASNSTISSIVQDGQASGDIEGYEISATGQISARLSSGGTTVLSTLGIANFNNEEGLTRVGGSLFDATQRSGEASVSAAGQGGVGDLQSGALELSNVDLADQFVDLVIYQRGYSASSQVFSSAGDMLRDTIALIR
ncbi:flagellar hook protein FlgE [bacterium]|nr:flagellar hook protein FlgE [bacterium]